MSSKLAWDAVAVEYERRVQPLTASFAPALLEEVGPLSGKRLLDVAAGSGAVALLAASQGATVVASDVSPRMLELLQREADTKFRHDSSAGEGQTGAIEQTVVSDGESLPSVLEARFDVACSSFGLIFFDHPERGLSELCRTLRPGGIVAISAWGAPRETQAFRVLPDAAARVLPAQQSDAAKPKRIDGTPPALRAFFEAGGLRDVRIAGPITRMLQVASATDYWDRFALGAPGTQKLLASLALDERDALRAEVLRELHDKFGDGPVALPVNAYFAIGRTPC